MCENITLALDSELLQFTGFSFSLPSPSARSTFFTQILPFIFFLLSRRKQWKAISNLFVIRLSVIEEILDSYEEYMYIHIHVRGLLDCQV